jgi:hypothetical protein
LVNDAKLVPAGTKNLSIFTNRNGRKLCSGRNKFPFISRCRAAMKIHPQSIAPVAGSVDRFTAGFFALVL